jgi:hypothetical protein
MIPVAIVFLVKIGKELGKTLLKNNGAKNIKL